MSEYQKWLPSHSSPLEPDVGGFTVRITAPVCGLILCNVPPPSTLQMASSCQASPLVPGPGQLKLVAIDVE